VQVDAPELEVQRTRLMQGTVLVIGICALGLVLVTFITARREEHAADRRVRAPTMAPPPAPAADVLGRRFEIMARGLHEREFIKETFGRYLSHRVAEALLAEHGAMFMPGEEREVTVLHGVLVHFGEVLAKTPPRDVVAVLNEFHAAMAGLVDGHGGTILEFHGPEIVAVFGAPVALIDHSERAVRCALQMRERLQALNREWEKSGRARTWQAGGVAAIRMGMGIHKSRVIAGNAGSSSRMKYNVMGEAVDVAAAIEHLATDFGTDILISEEVLRAIPDGVITATEKGSQKVEGRSDVRLFAV
jgi:class 3 adenylate cyclase